MPTIRDVARVSGVSIATVSHVLNNRTSKVAPETRERVLAAVRELRYRPTALEDRQRAILTRNLAFLVSDLTLYPITKNFYFGEILNGVLEAAALRGYSVTISIERMWDDVGHLIRRSYDGHCDGVLLLAPGPHSESLKTLWERGTPLVTVGSSCNLKGVSSVDIDNFAVAEEAVKLLWANGHRRFAFIGGGVTSLSALERGSTFLRTAAELGAKEGDVAAVYLRGNSEDWEMRPKAKDMLDPSQPLLGSAFDFQGNEEDAVRAVLERFVPEATAFFCWNDGGGRRVVETLRAMGHRVPEDYSVVSIDDSPDAILAQPNLTTFRQPYHEIGLAAVNALLDRLADHRLPERHIRFQAEAVTRQSLGPAPR